MRASIAAELAGIPAVSLVCGGFTRQGLATGRGLGLDGMSLAVLVGHVDAQPTDVMLKNLADVTFQQVVSGLTDAGPEAWDQAPEPSIEVREVHR